MLPLIFKQNILSVVMLLFIIISLQTAGKIHASEVALLHKGLVLNAKLEFAENKKYADNMILITHAGLGHNGMEIITYLQSKLKQFGYNTLAINLSLGLNNRHGMYNCKDTHRHRFTDAADEIGVWLQWLRDQGAGSVTLLGHSRGAGQTALYVSERDNTQINAVVLLAPDTRGTNDAAAYLQRHRQQLESVLEKTQNLISAGKGDTVLEHAGILYCADTSVSAETFVSYYGSDPRLDTTFLVKKIGKPTLVLIAGSDEVVIDYNTSFTPSGVGNKIQVKTIEGSDHFFRDLYADDAIDEIITFIKSLRN